MKRLLSLLVVIAAMGAFSGVSVARLICNAANNCFTRTTNPPTNDIYAVGGRVAGNVVKSYTEVALDYTGSWLPTSGLGTQNLGSQAFNWDVLYATAAVFSSGSITAGTGGFVGAAGPTSLQIQTTVQLALDVYPVGTLTLVAESTGAYPVTVTNAYNICETTSIVSSPTQTNSVYVAVATNTNSGAAAGGACNK